MSVSDNELTVSGNDTYNTVYQAVYDANLDTLALQEVTDGQSIGSTALSFFTGILENKALPVDYVIYVGDAYTYDSGNYERTAYEYCMVYGDLSCNGTTFTGEGCTLVTMRSSGNPSVTYEENVTVELMAPLYYSKSNLGTYAGVIQYPWMEFLLLILGMIGGLVWFMRKLMRLKY